MEYFFCIVQQWAIIALIEKKYWKKAREKYHNKGGKEKTAKYYKDNIKVLREDERNRYRNLSEEEKEKEKEVSNRQVSHEYWFKWKTKTLLNKLLCFKEDKKIKHIFFCII